MIDRRDFLKGASAAGAAGLLGASAAPASAEPPPETTRLRLPQIPGICVAPQYVAEELLRAEGFTEIEYVKRPPGMSYDGYASGEVDISVAFVAPFIPLVDRGLPIVMLAGVHVGCFELFGTEQVRSIRDLKGKNVGVPSMGSAHHFFLASMLSYVGLDPRRDIKWVEHPVADSVRVLTEKKVDALIGFPPVPQELRARKIGHVVINSGVDRPWSQYLCCIITGRRDFVRKNPVATKRAVRAILKAADLCAAEPERAARLIVDKGFTPQYEYALQTMKEISYGRWRQYDAEDAVRFYALRLHESGMIRSNPKKIIAEGTDWRFLNELKRELKG